MSYCQWLPLVLDIMKICMDFGLYDAFPSSDDPEMVNQLNSFNSLVLSTYLLYLKWNVGMLVVIICILWCQQCHCGDHRHRGGVVEEAGVLAHHNHGPSRETSSCSSPHCSRATVLAFSLRANSNDRHDAWTILEQREWKQVAPWLDVRSRRRCWSRI
jgi:hypothetical protein